ncbi:MAG: ornithine--oxo-acid transaminase [Dehalococcoidia bacterium]
MPRKMGSKEYIEWVNKYVVQTYHPLPIVYSRGEGVWVWDPEGKKYMEMLSCYSTLGLGHPAHPEVLRAFVSQAKRVGISSGAFYNEQLGPFAKELAEFCGMAKVLPVNSGAEAVERTIKIARKWGYVVKGIERDKAEVIACENNFHGRTITVVSFSDNPSYSRYFGPLTPGFKVIPFGNVEALEKAINKNSAAFLVEPIQGEGGVIVPPDGYLRKAKELCEKHNVLFILDEVQTGLGRCGKRFAYEYEDAKPDMLILGKFLGGGLAKVAAVVCSEKTANVLEYPEDGSTFSAQPESLAAARVALKILVRDRLAENAFEVGNYFRKRLGEIANPLIKEIRGKGLLVAIEFKPEAGGARKFAEGLVEAGIACKETHQHVIRFAPPLIIKKEEIDWAVERIRRVLGT